jgi:hypothetical protein
MGFLLSSIIPRIVARLNDPNQQIYTTAALLPYAQDAGDELQAVLELNGALVLEQISTIIPFPISLNENQENLVSLGNGGDGSISGGGPKTSLIPSDMYEPQRLEERLTGTTDQFIPMIRRAWEPNIQPTDNLRYWSYRDEDIFFVGCTNAIDIKIYYVKKLINISSSSSSINVNNAQQFMINRIAAMAARYIGENTTRADELDKEAGENLDWVVRIGVKSKQGARTRRRPFILVGRRRWA